MTASSRNGAGHVARNSVLNLLGKILPSLVAVVTLPIIVRGLGREEFGILSVAWLVLGYSSIFDLGLGRATTKFVAEYSRPEKSHLLPGLVWTSLGLQLIQGLVGAILIASSVPFVVTHLFKMPSAYIGEAKTTLLVLCAALPVLLVGNAIRGILEATQRFDLSNLVSVPASVAFYLLAPIAVALHIRVSGIVFLQVVIRGIAASAYLVLSLRELPVLRHGISFSKTAFKPLASYGGWCTVSAIAGPTFGELERFMIASIVSVGALTYYSAPYELITKIVIFPAALCSALFPFFSYHGSSSGGVISDLTSRAMKFLFLVMTPFTAILVFFAQDILRLWLGGDFPAQSGVILQVLAVSFFLNVFAQVPYTSVQALGRPDLKAVLDLILLPTYAAAAWVLLHRLGTNGAAYAKLFVTFLDTSCLFVFAWRLKAFSPGAWKAGYPARAVGASGVLVLAIFAVKSMHLAVPQVCVLLFLCCAGYLWLFWRFVVDVAEKATFKTLPRRLLYRTGSVSERGAVLSQ